MKLSELSNTKLRVISAVVMLAIVGIAILLEGYGIPFLHIKPFHAIRIFAVIVMLLGMYEMVQNILKTETNKKGLYYSFLALLFVDTLAVYHVATNPWILLLLLSIIVGADVGAWLFGKLFGGDKMWERISEHKTWAGQIGGIVCGTFCGVMYGLLGADVFRPELLWIGIAVSLLSQYGDLTASYIKRNLGIKDFGNTIPGHGGILDRFDGWIYVLPLVWFIIQ